MRTDAGYQWLTNTFQLQRIDNCPQCIIDSAVRGRQKIDLGTHKINLFASSYQPENTLTGHLQFAMRYEGVNLQVLGLLFEKIDPTSLCDWILESPTSAYARRACFFFEWLMEIKLAIENPVSSKMGYVDAVDTSLQFAVSKGDKSLRFRVNNNLSGTRDFCPLVHKTEYLVEMVCTNLRQRTRDALGKYDQGLLRRAAGFLYLKETQSSFEVEREKPSTNKAQRFADLLAQADTAQPLSESRFVELQNAVVDSRFHEFTWRQEQNWIGKDLGYRKQVDFVPPRPEDLPSLMQGLLDNAAKARSLTEPVVDEDKALETLPFDPVIYAAIISFGFVFIHPFMDGNGRIHRYLIHEVLANAGFTPRGIVLPVSAVILSQLDDYIAVLESFSKTVRERTVYNPDLPRKSAVGNDAIYFRYFDATEQAEFLYQALERTVEEDLQKEIEFLLGFDIACMKLNQQLDWPGHEMELFVQVVHQNSGNLSKAKRKSHFAWMKPEEISDAETIVREAFEMSKKP